MIIRRLFFAVAFLVLVSTNISCEKEDVTQTEQDQQAVKKSEIDEDDT